MPQAGQAPELTEDAHGWNDKTPSWTWGPLAGWREAPGSMTEAAG